MGFLCPNFMQLQFYVQQKLFLPQIVTYFQNFQELPLKHLT